MSDIIKHECGIALIRLRKPLNYYIEKYGTPTYAMSKLYLLMEIKYKFYVKKVRIQLYNVFAQSFTTFMVSIIKLKRKHFKNLYSKNVDHVEHFYKLGQSVTDNCNRLFRHVRNVLSILNSTWWFLIKWSKTKKA